MGFVSRAFLVLHFVFVLHARSPPHVVKNMSQLDKIREKAPREQIGTKRFRTTTADYGTKLSNYLLVVESNNELSHTTSSSEG